MKQWAKLQLTAAHICNLHLEQYLLHVSPSEFPLQLLHVPLGKPESLKPLINFTGETSYARGLV